MVSLMDHHDMATSTWPLAAIYHDHHYNITDQCIFDPNMGQYNCAASSAMLPILLNITSYPDRLGTG